jgi:glyoxylase I family protein
VEMKLRPWNRNYVGTHFGGSLYSMTDPFYMLMLIHNLGPDYIVWDKAATIRFRKPGRGTVRAEFRLSEGQVQEICDKLKTQEKLEPVFTIEVKDKEGVVVAEVEKLIYVRRRSGETTKKCIPQGRGPSHYTRLEIVGGSMNPAQRHEEETAALSARAQSPIVGLWGVRYQVKDVRRSVGFYTETLRFNLDRQNLPAFAQVSVPNLKLILSGPGASGSRPMPDGRQQEPGGWNRVVLQVKDLSGQITQLKNEGVRFRNEMEVGPGGKQIQVEDPDGNPIELFEPAQH